MDINGINIIHLLKKGKPDLEVIELMAEAGVHRLFFSI